MILKRVFVVVFIAFMSNSYAFQLKKSILKKTHKAIVKTFESKEVSLEKIVVNEKVNKQLFKRIGPHNLYKIIADKNFIGYAYVDKAPSKTDTFDYLILLDTDLIIKKTKVLAYREDYGGEIGSRRWLKQFIGKTSSDSLKYEKEIIAISGATISARAMTVAINTFLKNINTLKENKIL
jgi:Na+-translocating ferredoxin:NAD+ oxidoreductase RnfG subunit